MKIVLITRAAGGLGKAIVYHLAQNEFTVFATDIKPIDNDFPNPHLVHCLHLDVTSVENLTEVYHEVSSKTNGLNGLINNAGVSLFGPTVEANPADLKNLLGVNFIGPQLVTQTFFPLLFQNKGRVVNISSKSIKYLAPFCLYPMF